MSFFNSQCFDSNSFGFKGNPSKYFDLDPLIPIINILQIPNDYRSEKDIQKIQNFLESQKPFSLLLNISNNNQVHNLIIELSKAFTFKFYKRGTIINKAGSKDDLFQLILKGEITELGLKYEKITLDKDDFFAFLLKLYLLKEKELLNSCISLNKHYFLNNPEITNFTTFIENKSNEHAQQLINTIKLEIKYSKWKIYRNINDYIDLLSIKPRKISLNTQSKPKFLLFIPKYQINRVISEGEVIGHLTPNINVKMYNCYITSSNVEGCSFYKSELVEKYLFSHMKKILKPNLWDFLSSMFIFQDYNKEEFERKFITNFTYKKFKKGDLLFRQNFHSHGIYFVKNGSYKITTIRKYIEINDLISLLKQSLTTNYSTFVSDFSEFKENEDFSNPLTRAHEFGVQSKEQKEITLTMTNNKQVFGLSELLYYKNEMSLFNVECISDESEVYYIPKESFFLMVNNNITLKTRCAKLVEEKAKFYIFLLQRYKSLFMKEIEKVVINESIKPIPKKIQKIKMSLPSSPNFNTFSTLTIKTQKNFTRSMSNNIYSGEEHKLDFYKTITGNKNIGFYKNTDYINKNPKHNVMSKTMKTFFNLENTNRPKIKINIKDKPRMFSSELSSYYHHKNEKSHEMPNIFPLTTKNKKNVKIKIL